MEKNSIIKIAVIGAESTGKSSLVKDLAQYYKTTYVSEYAREFFNTHNINSYTIEVFDTIYRTQINNENLALIHANNLLFCDTSLITGKIWSDEVFGITAKYIDDNLTKVKYDLYLVMKNDLPWVKDDQRKNPHNRNEIFEKNIDELKKINARYELIDGLNEQRLNNAIIKINKIFGYN